MGNLLCTTIDEKVHKYENICAVLFDLDGTLINSLDLHITSFQWILKKLGKEVSADSLEKLMGKTPQDIIQTYFKNLPQEQLWAAAKEKENYLGKIVQHVYVYEGVLQLLRQLGNRGIKRIVISSTYRELVKLLLEKGGLLQEIDEIVSGEEVRKGKPDPEPFRKGVAKVQQLMHRNTSACNMLAVGDAIYDGQSATAAGLQFIGVLTGKTSAEIFEAAGFTQLISGVKTLQIENAEIE